MKLYPDYNENGMVVAYYRYSSSSQNEASIEQQRDMVQRWAKSQGLVVVSEYEDAAKTGTNANRPGYQLMLRELPKIKPAYVAVWKNDRLARDRAELLLAKQAIRVAGARVHYIEGISPTDSPDSVLMEGVADAFAEYYSLQLSANIRRGQRYNAERALSNGHRIFGFTVDTEKRYIADPETAPIVTQIFDDYAHGVSMQKIADRLNAQGVRTTRGYRFTPKNLNKILKNRAYIGEYSYGGYVIEDGMPRLVEDDVFDEVQRRFAINKRRGAKTKAELAAQGDDAPDYWLTGHAYCLTCGGPMEGVSGTSKTGRKYRYYYCLNQRKKQCTAKTVRKDEIEARVEEIVESFLAEPEMLASLAVDLADHYQKTHGRGDEILKALEARRTDVEAKLANFVKAISQGIFNSTTADAMNALEAQKAELDAAIQAEHVKATLFEDEASIGAFYRRFAQATIDTPETREQLFEYFVDKVFIGRDQIVVASYFHDSTAPIEFEDLEEALTSGHRAGEVRTYARKREFNTSPSGGARGIRTPDLLIANETRYQLRHSPKCGLILAPLLGVLASSVAVSPPTAPDFPGPPGRATASHGLTITRRPRAAPRGWHRGRWGGRALPHRPPRERERRHGPSADGRAPARRCQDRPPGPRRSVGEPGPPACRSGRAHGPASSPEAGSTSSSPPWRPPPSRREQRRQEPAAAHPDGPAQRPPARRPEQPAGHAREPRRPRPRPSAPPAR